MTADKLARREKIAKILIKQFNVGMLLNEPFFDELEAALREREVPDEPFKMICGHWSGCQVATNTIPTGLECSACTAVAEERERCAKIIIQENTSTAYWRLGAVLVKAIRAGVAP
jgi:hypothetical protein